MTENAYHTILSAKKTISDIPPYCLPMSLQKKTIIESGKGNL